MRQFFVLYATLKRTSNKIAQKKEYPNGYSKNLKPFLVLSIYFS